MDWPRSSAGGRQSAHPGQGFGDLGGGGFQEHKAGSTSGDHHRHITSSSSTTHVYCFSLIEHSYARHRGIGIMSGPKAALKAIGAAIKAQKYDDAIQEAQKLLAADPKSYQA